MERQVLTINNQKQQIRALLWGDCHRPLLLAVHGAQASKEDPTIRQAAQIAFEQGYSTLSFDLPQHGERAHEHDYPCNPWNGSSDLLTVYRYALSLSADISIFACSLGAYFTLLAYPQMRLQKLLFLSPVVSMERLLQNMMTAFGVTAERLAAEKHIAVPNGMPLDWDYYCYVSQHPLPDRLNCPLSILYGARDELVAESDVREFAATRGGSVRVLAEGEHYFHTPDQLKVLSSWLMAEL